jgi:hypothetical protein
MTLIKKGLPEFHPSKPNPGSLGTPEFHPRKPKPGLLDWIKAKAPSLAVFFV